MTQTRIGLTQLKAKLFCGFGDPSRLAILDSLKDQKLSVSEIVEATGLTQSNVSNHLGCLRDCGLVSSKQEGRFVYYSLSSGHVSELLMLAEQILDGIAGKVDACESYSPKPQSRAKRLTSVK